MTNDRRAQAKVTGCRSLHSQDSCFACCCSLKLLSLPGSQGSHPWQKPTQPCHLHKWLHACAMTRWSDACIARPAFQIAGLALVYFGR